jgi:hypothetical protein
MRDDDDRRWADDIDLDRVRATPRGIIGGWIVVAVVAALMTGVPPTVDALDDAVLAARHNATKVEQRLAQILPQAMAECLRSG